MYRKNTERMKKGCVIQESFIQIGAFLQLWSTQQFMVYIC